METNFITFLQSVVKIVQLVKTFKGWKDNTEADCIVIS
jgi:hypothetical protein